MPPIQSKGVETVSDELALVRAAKRGDMGAFEQLVKKEIEKWRPIVVKYDIKYD